MSVDLSTQRSHFTGRGASRDVPRRLIAPGRLEEQSDKPMAKEFSITLFRLKADVTDSEVAAHSLDLRIRLKTSGCSYCVSPLDKAANQGCASILPVKQHEWSARGSRG